MDSAEPARMDFSSASVSVCTGVAAGSVTAAAAGAVADSENNKHESSANFGVTDLTPGCTSAPPDPGLRYPTLTPAQNAAGRLFVSQLPLYQASRCRDSTGGPGFQLLAVASRSAELPRLTLCWLVRTSLRAIPALSTESARPVPPTSFPARRALNLGPPMAAPLRGLRHADKHS
jgi:hypothetical protein